jgi:hypothetical protein
VVCLILLKAASVLKLKPFLPKRISKACNAAMNGFPKAANGNTNKYIYVNEETSQQPRSMEYANS